MKSKIASDRKQKLLKDAKAHSRRPSMPAPKIIEMKTLYNRAKAKEQLRHYEY